MHWMRQSQSARPAEEREPLTLKAVQDALAPDQALISYYVIEDAVHAFVLDRNGLSRTRPWCGSAAASAMAVSTLSAGTRPNRSGSLRRSQPCSLAALYDALFCRSLHAWRIRACGPSFRTALCTLFRFTAFAIRRDFSRTAIRFLIFRARPFTCTACGRSQTSKTFCCSGIPMRWLRSSEKKSRKSIASIPMPRSWKAWKRIR